VGVKSADSFSFGEEVVRGKFCGIFVLSIVLIFKTMFLYLSDNDIWEMGMQYLCSVRH
jgi:hypothetical protein